MKFLIPSLALIAFASVSQAATKAVSCQATYPSFQAAKAACGSVGAARDRFTGAHVYKCACGTFDPSKPAK